MPPKFTGAIMTAATAVMTRFRKYSRRAVAAFLSIWLSGIAFLLFCQLPAKAAGEDFCPLAKASRGHCDRSSDKTKRELVSNGTSQSFDCCSFLPAVFDKSRKLERGVKGLVAPKAEDHTISRPRLAPITIRPPSDYTSYVPIRDRIFIRNRVFRI